MLKLPTVYVFEVLLAWRNNSKGKFRKRNTDHLEKRIVLLPIFSTEYVQYIPLILYELQLC